MTRRSGQPVSIRDVSKSYADVSALRDVNIDISAGEFCTLLGASGSGKTTLLKAIAGFEPHDTGQIKIGERDVDGMPVAERNIGMVFQSYALFPHMSVSQNVAFGLDMRHVPKAENIQRVDDVLNLVGLSELGDRLPGELSGGQQQRVALARALVIEPDILLMDEPLGALDKKLRLSIQLQLKQLHQALGATIVYVTHDQEEAMHLSDRIVILDKGKVVQIGTPQELYSKPKNKFVAGFLGECNFLTLDDGSDVGLRPEALAIASAEREYDSRLSIELETSVFVGANIKLVGHSNQQQIIALIGSGDLAEMPTPGSQLELAFDRRSVIRF